MMFPEKIKNIKPTDKVLEVGPGGLPYFRSDVFLEKTYDDPLEFAGQRGFHDPLKTEKKVVFFDGKEFPFKDNEFDYVICSHVIEHVPDIDVFSSELQRVAKKGYIEFPTIYYDYLYNFNEHISSPYFKDGIIYWMKKSETLIDNFKPIQQLFKNYNLTNKNEINIVFKNIFFQGIEWEGEIKTQFVHDLNKIVFSESDLNKYVPPSSKSEIEIAVRKLGYLLLKKIGLK